MLLSIRTVKKKSGNKCDKEHIFSWNYITPWGQKLSELQMKCKRLNKQLIHTYNAKNAVSAQVGRIPPLGTTAKSSVLLMYSLNWLYEEQTSLNFTVKITQK